MQKTLFFAALTASTALTAPAFAQDFVQDDALVLDEIVIYSGALEPRPGGTTAQAVSVLSRADLERTGQTRLTELLQSMPGVGVIARGHVGTQAGFTVRGLSQNYVKVTVDGIDVSDPSAPQVAYDPGRLNSFNFDRVELLRGSQSAVHGGQAVAGVLSLGTPRATKEGISHSVALEAGAYDTLNAAYTFAVKRGAQEFSAQLSKLRSDGFSAADENNGNTEADGYEAVRLSMRGETPVGDGLVLGFAAFAQNDEGGFDNAFANPPVDGFDTTTHRERGARIYARTSTGPVDHELGISYFTTWRGYTSAFGPYDYSGKRRTLDWKAGTDLGAGRLTFGAERKLEDYEGTYVTGRVQTRTTGVFGEYAFSPMQGVDVVASLRHDDHSQFGGFTTGRLGATWAVNADTILRASLGTGYRAPSGYELYDPFAGNPALEPERSTSVDLGIEKRFGTTSLQATLFRIETRDLIDYAGGYYQTSGKAVRQGLELGAGGQLGAGRYTLSYTWLDRKDPAGLSAGSSWNSSFGKHTLAASYEADLSDRLTGAVAGRFVSGRPNLPGYGVVDAQVRYDLGEGREAYLRVENLFDKEYQLFPGYGTSDRAAYLGLRAKF